MARLPVPGSDEDVWGEILNAYLRVEHAEDGTHRTDVFGVFNAKSFGARGDGVADDTPAIQAALDAASASGGVVWLPPTDGAYRCDGGLTIPGHVSLRGGYGGMRRGLQLWEETPRGSVLHVYGTEDFITMSHNSVLDGVEIFYPEQVASGTPTPYEWAVRVPSDQHGVTIRNVTCPNPYQFIHINADGFLIDGVQGFPLLKGIQLARVADVPRINNVHFNPNVRPAMDDSLRNWVRANGSCLDMDYVEEFMVHNFFAYGYLRGVWFHGEGGGASYGSINNFGLDIVQEGILVETTGIHGRQGVSISNGRIVPAGPEGARAGIKFIDTALSDVKRNPAVSLSNVGFFAPHERSFWIGPDSGARLTVLGGQSTEYLNEMVLCQSELARVRLVGVRSAGGSGPRVNNPGGGDVQDAYGIAD